MPGKGVQVMTKTEKDRELVRRCITEKWALLVKDPDMREPLCPLCYEYSPTCSGCPIREKTHSMDCRKTPYTDWIQGHRDSHHARAELAFLWELHDELSARITEENTAPRAKKKAPPMRPCVVCGRTIRLRWGGSPVCHRCARECYDADGYYLVPVVRGGPWHCAEPNAWEVWVDGDCAGWSRDGYVIKVSSVYGPGGNTTAPICLTRPGVVLKAPRDYIGECPEGCRWAEGSKPKPKPKPEYDESCYTCKYHALPLNDYPCNICEDESHWKAIAPTADIDGRSVTITARADEDGKLSDYISAMPVARAIHDEHGVAVAPNQVSLAEPIRELGVYDVVVKLHGRPDATVKVWVVKEEGADPRA